MVLLSLIKGITYLVSLLPSIMKGMCISLIPLSLQGRTPQVQDVRISPKTNQTLIYILHGKVTLNPEEEIFTDPSKNLIKCLLLSLS